MSQTVKNVGINKIIVVVGYGKEHVVECLKGEGVEFVHQKKQLGTAHALSVCKEKLRGFRRSILVLPGDIYLHDARALKRFCSFQKKKNAPEMSILTTNIHDPYGYGRIIRDAYSNVCAIREELDASQSEKRITEINTGIYLFRGNTLFRYLEHVKKNSKKQEYYLTDVVNVYLKKKKKVEGYASHCAHGVLGINDRVQLSEIQKLANSEIIKKHQRNGVTVIAPENTYIEDLVVIGSDTVIYPFTYIEKDVRIGKGCTIGPFCKIRSRTTIKARAAIGSFVEVVRSHVGSDTKIKHLSYIGDAYIGKNVNVGAGTITANYDGKRKAETTIKDGALIGSNTVLVAPLTVGEGAITGAGSVVPKGKDVPRKSIAYGVPARIVKK